MSGQRGFTLVELLVALTMSSVVLFGASALMISSLHETKQVTGRVAATQQGRTGVETLLAELNSGCLVNSVSPVMKSSSSGITPAVNSDGSDLVFVSGVGDSATPTPTEHVVTVNNGALIDSSYKNTGGNPPALGVAATWTFASTPFRVLNLADHVTSGSQQMFSYHAYSTTTNSLLNAPALTPPFTAATAANVAEVDLDITFGPSVGSSDPSQTTELQNSAVFSLSADGSAAQNGPCE